MDVRITKRHMEGGTGHEHIASVKWIGSDNKEVESTRAQMVKWINDGGKAYVSDGTNKVWVGVVNASPPYIRTYADGVWTDNLLALPTF